MRGLLIFVALLFLNTACDQGKIGSSRNRGPKAELSGPTLERDLAEIQADGKLKAIMVYSSTTYFLYRGEAMGYEYELLKRLAQDLGLELEIVLANNIDEVFDMLNRGEGDIIAYGLTITEDRKKLINFTDYLYTTHQALVQRKPRNWRRLSRDQIDRKLVRDVIDLIGDTVHVHRRSSYYERMLHLQEELGGKINIDTIIGDYNIEDVIKMVVDGKIKYAIADYNVASINQTFYPILDVETPVSFSQRIAWGLRSNSPELENEVNRWIQGMRKNGTYAFIYKKYYVHKKSYKRRVQSEFYSKNSGQISKYDDLIRRAADSLSWDWRLLASQVYQESRFDPQSESWAGAGGLMQIMPGTATDLGIDNTYDPEQNLMAAADYLKDIFDKFENIPDTIQRIKFTMAAYNCGYGHLLDAQRLAAQAGLDSLQFDDATAIWLRKMGQYKVYSNPIVRYGPVRGEEPFRYVRDIFLRYAHYRQLIPAMPSDSLVSSAEPR
ncbi:MltF family protein [Croceimicrobium hydrocarbonivorans]|uniref:Transporter substrate-binding domain-containing protein n=1 Tax=Croceimicrobium hydrocarbonivorans TaxID=2761580 RepID=A0A7H0VA65_9FLAO|nr:transporter substrate-binding domain-containing protein [Croceimicrobium hydrocarbonivorans]QNR22613.1 transporter substrate-binding domain-containing protein [Croceimicrobium hydrocarbonivorans]